MGDFNKMISLSS